jgi:hypothetical protein
VIKKPFLIIQINSLSLSLSLCVCVCVIPIVSSFLSFFLYHCISLVLLCLPFCSSLSASLCPFVSFTLIVFFLPFSQFYLSLSLPHTSPSFFVPFFLLFVCFVLPCNHPLSSFFFHFLLIYFFFFFLRFVCLYLISKYLCFFLSLLLYFLALTTFFSVFLSL